MQTFKTFICPCVHSAGPSVRANTQNVYLSMHVPPFHQSVRTLKTSIRPCVQLQSICPCVPYFWLNLEAIFFGKFWRAQVPSVHLSVCTIFGPNFTANKFWSVCARQVSLVHPSVCTFFWAHFGGNQFRSICACPSVCTFFWAQFCSKQFWSICA